MQNLDRIKNTGLRGVVVADTKISHSDSESGMLIYRGYRIEELAERATYEETAYLLLHGDLPTENQFLEFKHTLVQARKISPTLYECLKQLPKTAQPMDVLQASIPLLGMEDSEQCSETREANMGKAVRLIARIPAVIAGWEMIRKDLDPIPPDAKLSHAENFLWQVTAKKPNPDAARTLDTVLVLHADHTFGASTFMCRGVASTQANMYSSVTAGIGALSGRLHGGANAQVMKMLLSLRNESDIPGWVKKQLDNGEKIMGMGNAIFKGGDPRARFLRNMCEKLGRKMKQEHWWRILTEVEKSALLEFDKRGKTTIRPNMDFYSAPVYYMLGIPLDLMTPVFAVGRIAGWAAHIIEEKFGDAQGKPALYRPSSAYVGPYCGKKGCVIMPTGLRT